MAGSGLDLKRLVFFVPPNLKRFKLALFERIGQHIRALGGSVLYHDFAAVGTLPDDKIPIVGCSVEFAQTFKDWRERGRQWIYWDRGYFRRRFSTWLPYGRDMGLHEGFFRWHINRPQMSEIYDVPDDRWKFLKLDQQCEKGNQIKPWNKNGKHIVVIGTMQEYFDLWLEPNWIQQTVNVLKQYTDRPITVRHHQSTLSLKEEIKDAHCLVTHGSVAAVEAVVWGCPVFVSDMSAAKLVGLTDFSKIETPVYPERQPWLSSLAYCQYHEQELLDGTLWQLIR